MQITLGQEYNVGEKPTVILYIYNSIMSGRSPPLYCTLILITREEVV